MLKRNAIIVAEVILICLTAACGRRTDEAASLNRQRYHAVVRETVHLYTRLHPLRSSRLALYAADSTLFTFSPGEIDEAGGEIERLQGTVSRIAPEFLDRRHIDNLTLVIHWLKGERLALGELAPHRRQPLLYCWIAEEALYGIPSRIRPPYPGEREAYERRIARIPVLLSNAELLLENPPKPHVALATRRTATLLAALDDLNDTITKRYGKDIAGLTRVRQSLERFSRFLSTDLSRRAHGSMIIGSENLWQIILYDESLTIDPSWIDREAERTIERLKGRAATIRKRIDAISESPSPVPPVLSELDSLLLPRQPPDDAAPRHMTRYPDSTVLRDIEILERAVARSGRFGARPATAAVEYAGDTAGRLPPNPHLTLPVPETERLFTIPPTPFAHPPCSEYIIRHKMGAPHDTDDYAYALLGVLFPVRECDRLPCIEADTVRTILSSATHRESWRRIIIEELIDQFRVRRSALQLRLIEEDIRALVRMQVVLRLHAGRFTAEQATEYLTGIIDGLSADEARSEYILASVSPSIAYRGISLLITEDLFKAGELSRGAASPRQRLQELMRLHTGLPLSLIREKMQE